MLKIKNMKNSKWIVMLATAMMMVMAASCGEKPAIIPDDEVPPHVTPPEPPVDVKPSYDKGEGVIRLLSYNVGAFNKYTNSIDMIAKMIKELDADIVGLNEVDSCTTRTGRVNQAKKLAERLGEWTPVLATMHPYKDGGYGNAIVMSPDYKLTGKKKMELPKVSSSHETRSCAIAKNDKFVFMATHLEVNSEKARIQGAQTITEWAVEQYGNSDVPVFLCGDMNCEPNDAPIVELKKNWTMLSVADNTYPSSPSKPATKCIDFIFVLKNKAQYEFVKSEVPTKFENGSVTEASDHLPIYVDVKLK